MTYIEWLEDKCLHIFDESWVCDLMSEHADEWEYCSKHCENGKGECLRRLYKADRKTEPQYDFSEYADRLWKIAYERGKREALAKDEPQTERSGDGEDGENM